MGSQGHTPGVAGSRLSPVGRQDPGSFHLAASPRSHQMFSRSREADAKLNFSQTKRGPRAHCVGRYIQGVSCHLYPPRAVGIWSECPKGVQDHSCGGEAGGTNPRGAGRGEMEAKQAVTTTEINPSPPLHWPPCWASSHPDPTIRY